MYNFLIPSCIKNEIHEKQLERCISSIRYFHDKNIIYMKNNITLRSRAANRRNGP